MTYNTAVRTVTHGAEGVTLTLDDGSKVEADYVVIAVPLGVLKRPASEGGLSFSPPLSARTSRPRSSSLGWAPRTRSL